MANTAIKGLNIDAIRELNKIQIYAVKNKETIASKGEVDAGNPSFMEKIFSAYLTSPLGKFDASPTSNSLTQSIGNFIGQSSIVSSLAQTAIGQLVTGLGTNNGKYRPIGQWFASGSELSNVLNYNFNYRFVGTNEFKHTFQCELVVKDDFFDDVINPLWSLLSYVMPDETEQLYETEVYKSGKGTVQSFYNDNIKEPINNANKKYDVVNQDTLDKVWKFIEAWGGETDDMLGGISILTQPKQLQSGNLFTRILIGNYIVIDNVIIDSVDFDIPYLFYEGGLFDKVTVSMTVKGNRKMSLKTYNWIKDLKEGREKYGDNWKDTKGDTLNKLYNGDKKRNDDAELRKKNIGVDTINVDTSGTA